MGSFTTINHCMTSLGNRSNNSNVHEVKKNVRKNPFLKIGPRIFLGSFLLSKMFVRGNGFKKNVSLIIFYPWKYRPIFTYVNDFVKMSGNFFRRYCSTQPLRTYRATFTKTTQRAYVYCRLCALSMKGVDQQPASLETYGEYSENIFCGRKTERSLKERFRHIQETISKEWWLKEAHSESGTNF